MPSAAESTSAWPLGWRRNAPAGRAGLDLELKGSHRRCDGAAKITVTACRRSLAGDIADDDPAAVVDTPHVIESRPRASGALGARGCSSSWRARLPRQDSGLGPQQQAPVAEFVSESNDHWLGRRAFSIATASTGRDLFGRLRGRNRSRLRSDLRLGVDKGRRRRAPISQFHIGPLDCPERMPTARSSSRSTVIDSDDQPTSRRGSAGRTATLPVENHPFRPCSGSSRSG